VSKARGTIKDVGRINRNWQNCQLCKLHEGRINVVHCRGNPSAKLLVVGEAPGAHEDELGQPFVGPAGQELDRCFKSAGVEEHQAFIVNLVACRPPMNRDPSPLEIKACHPRFLAYVNMLKPKAMLLLGKVASRRLAGVTNITQWSGRKVDVEMITMTGDIGVWPAICTFHPSFLLRTCDPLARKCVIKDIAKARMLAYGL